MTAKNKPTKSGLVEQKNEQTKKGFWRRLLRSRWIWLIGGVFLLLVLGGLLISMYEPPFPPNWVGIKYYSYERDPEQLGNSSEQTGGSDSINFEDLSKISEKMKTIQTGLLVFEPVTPEAKRLLPALIVVHTYTLTDEAVIQMMTGNALAIHLAGIASQDRLAASQILQDPLAALRLRGLVIAVTQTNNFNEAEQQSSQLVSSKGEEVTPERYDTLQRKLQLAPDINPLQTNESPDQSLTLGNYITITKPSVYRIYENEQAKGVIDLDTLLKPYDSFVQINDTFVPIKKGRSPWVIFHPGRYRLQSGASASPVTFYHAVQTVNGYPYIWDNGPGHAWASVSFEENGTFYPLMTASFFNSIDMDNAINADAGEFTNIATYSNLWINHPDDWQRAVLSLNKIPLPDGPSRTRLNEITPEEAREILLLRAWYLAQYSTQEYYMRYLQESMAASNSLKDKLALQYAIIIVRIENIMNGTFWGLIQAAINHTWLDTRYNGVTSNCVAYSTAFWNRRGRNPYYDPRILKLIPAPSQLYRIMDPDEVITLPGAKTKPD